MKNKKAKRAICLIIALTLIFVSCSSAGNPGQMPGQAPGTAPAASGSAQGGTAGTTGTGSLPPSGAKASPEAGAKAAPGTGTKAPASFRFVVMGDSRGDDNGINSKVIKKIMGRVKLLSPQPSFAVLTGDLVDGAKSYKGVKSQLEYFKKTVTAFYPTSFFYPLLGNHETSNSSGGEKAFAEVFPEFKASKFLDGYNRTVYYIDRGEARLFMLDTDFPGELHQVSDKQLAFVKSNLKSSGVNLFFMHEPPFPTGANVGFSLDKNTLQRAKLWKLVDTSAGPEVICSHEHNYTRRHINSDFNVRISGVDYKFNKSVYQITSGGFGAPLYTQYTSKKDVDVPPIVKNNYLVIDISGSKFTLSAYDSDGKLLDSFSR